MLQINIMPIFYLLLLSMGSFSVFCGVLRVTEALLFSPNSPHLSTVIKHIFLSSPKYLFLMAFMRGGKMTHSSEIKVREAPPANGVKELDFYLPHRDPFQRNFFDLAVIHA